MADADSGDRTEKASAQKLRQARRDGQAPRSRELAMALGVLVALKLLVALLPGLLQDFRALFVLVLAPLDGDGTLDNAWSAIFPAAVGLLVKMLLPLAVLPAAAIAVSLVPGGLVVSAKPLAPDLSRLNPIANLARMVSPQRLTETALSLAKAAVLIAVLVHVVRSGAAGFVHLQDLPLPTALTNGAGMMLDGVMAMVAVLLLFGLVDLPAQVFFFLRRQRMSKRDLKDEHKSNEGSPQVRQRIRQLQRQMARRSIRKAVPTADVVVVNPEHYAVALKYYEDRAQAPYVVAKGIDEMALYIRELAAEHAVEVLELPPLARAIYNTSQVQQQIPMALYRAVAQVLTYVLQLKAFRSGQRRAQPSMPTDIAIPARLSEPRTP
jgi:flagellar biosynthetic protein FlhB